MGEVLAETNLPKGAFSILPAHREGADLFTTDERLKLLSFTGSPAVGWDLKAPQQRDIWIAPQHRGNRVGVEQVRHASIERRGAAGAGAPA